MKVIRSVVVSGTGETVDVTHLDRRQEFITGVTERVLSIYSDVEAEPEVITFNGRRFVPEALSG